MPRQPHGSNKPQGLTDTAIDTDTGAIVDSDTGVDSDSGGETAQDSEPETGADTDTGGDTQADTDTQVDTGPERDPVELAIDTAAGAKLIGEDPAGWGGGDMIVAGGCDLDGDGIGDVVVGMPSSDMGGGLASGVTYIVSGPVSGIQSLSIAASRWIGTAEHDSAGAAIANAGDTNGDGFDDLIVGAPRFGYPDDNIGQAYVILGPFSGEHSMTEADATLIGDETHCEWCYPSTGTVVDGGSDVDADGYDDVLVVAFEWQGYGAVNLLHGPLTGDIDLLTGSDTTIINDDGAPGTFGSCAGFAGDTDGDGLPDVLVGRWTDSGVASALRFADLGADALYSSSADIGIFDSSEIGVGGSCSGAGDVNADGYADLLFGTVYDDDLAPRAGGAVLFYGPFSGSPDVTTADAHMQSAVEEDLAGSSVSSAGDVNGDSYADILVGARGYWSDEPGAAYLVYGPVYGAMSLADADVHFLGEGTDMAGDVVAPAGDIDSDGLADFLISGPGDDDAGDDAGAAWLIYGASLP